MVDDDDPIKIVIHDHAESSKIIRRMTAQAYNTLYQRNRRRALKGDVVAMAWMAARPRRSNGRPAFDAASNVTPQMDRRYTGWTPPPPPDPDAIRAAYLAGHRIADIAVDHHTSPKGCYAILAEAGYIPAEFIENPTTWVLERYWEGTPQRTLARLLAVSQPAINQRIHRYLAFHGHPWGPTPKVRKRPLDISP